MGSSDILQTSPFFRLPRELRDEIYSYVFTDPQGLRYEYGTARLVGSTPHFFALRKVSRQIREETVDHPLKLNTIIFDNLSYRIPRPNFRKYYNRWDTEFSEENPDKDIVSKPISARVRSFLSRTSPEQRSVLHSMTIVELRPLEHISALLDLFDTCGLPAMRLTVVLVPSIIGTYQFDKHFLQYIERLLTKRWFRCSRHTVLLRLEGFEGLADWIETEFPPGANPANQPVQALLMLRMAELVSVVEKLNGLREGEDGEVSLEYMPMDLLIH